MSATYTKQMEYAHLFRKAYAAYVEANRVALDARIASAHAEDRLAEKTAALGKAFDALDTSLEESL